MSPDKKNFIANESQEEVKNQTDINEKISSAEYVK